MDGTLSREHCLAKVRGESIGYYVGSSRPPELIIDGLTTHRAGPEISEAQGKTKILAPLNIHFK